MEMIEKRDTSIQARERGMTLVIIAAGLVLLLGIAGLGVDLGMFYVTRNEAQRAADAAVLAGAQDLTKYETDFVDGTVVSDLVAADAAGLASQVGNQNLVVGRSPGLDPANFSTTCPAPTGKSGVCFNFSVSNDPRITVVVYENMPTIFARIFGITTVPVSAVSTAEIYFPSAGNGGTSGGPDVTVSCAKPWLLSNCDYDHEDPNTTVGSPDPNKDNTNCVDSTTGHYYEYFVNPNDGTIVNPTAWDGGPGGAFGEFLTIKPGSPTTAVAPSQFLPVFFPNPGSTSMAGVTYKCPTCASSDVNSASNNNNSAALYSENIECCSSVTLTCGLTAINPVQGNMVGPTGSGVDCLIHESSAGKGQDCISFDPNSPTTCLGAIYNPMTPFTVYAGSIAGPNYDGQPEGTPIQSSDSFVTVPLYPGNALCPGGSCSASVSVPTEGFLTLFISKEGPPNHSVYAYVTGITPCNPAASGSGSSGSAIAAPPSTSIPIRLIHSD
jgi:Flp pilus assembly protein TadG